MRVQSETVAKGGQCSSCKAIHYCSVDHQRKHRKQHRGLCKELGTFLLVQQLLPPQGLEVNPADHEEAEKLTAYGMQGLPRFHEEYKEAYPADGRGFCILRTQFIGETTGKAISLQEEIQGRRGCILDQFGNVGQILLKRWSHLGPGLLEYLARQKGQVGHVWREHPYLTGKKSGQYGDFSTTISVMSRQYQTMRNHYVPRIQLERGRCYISVGFVDLQQLLEAEVVGPDAAGPAVWRGLEMSQIAVARSRLILAMLVGDMPDEQILQIWYSTCISAHAGRALQNWSQKLAEIEEDVKQKQLFTHWGRASLTTEEATVRWRQHLGNEPLSVIGALLQRPDRVDYTRYLLTGQIFLHRSMGATGNPTLYCLPQGYNRYTKAAENIFNSVDINSLDYRESLKISLEKRFLEQLNAMRTNVIGGKLKIKAKVRLMAPDQNCREIQQLDPTHIDWSNLPDYLGIDKFFTMARQCSGKDTRHTFHLTNWSCYTFGYNLADYVPHTENYNVPGFGPDSTFKDSEGSLEHRVKLLRGMLKLMVEKSPKPSFININVDTMNAMNVCHTVFSKMYLDNYMNFLFEEQKINTSGWKIRPFSAISRSNGVADVSFDFKM